MPVWERELFCTKGRRKISVPFVLIVLPWVGGMQKSGKYPAKCKENPANLQKKKNDAKKDLKNALECDMMCKVLLNTIPR